MIELAGVTVGLERPWFLVAAPITALILGWLVLRGSGDASVRRRRRLLVSRLVLALLLVGAAAGPYTMDERRTAGEPRVTLLVDESRSMGVYPDTADRLATGVRDAGVPVERVTIASGNRSALGEGIGANLREGGTVLVLSDGQVTHGTSIDAIAERARGLNATVSSVTLDPNRRDRTVRLLGPAKTSRGVDTGFTAVVGGVQVDAPTVTITVDGEPVARRSVGDDGTVRVEYAFDEVGTHTLSARVAGQDAIASNDVYRKTVRVVPPPRVLYVSDRVLPFRNYLDDLYNVTTADRVPDDLSPYYAVVTQDLPAGSMGNISALQRFAIDGNGLVVVGGPNAYEGGGYDASPIGAALPVEVGASTGGSTTIVLLFDVSGSAAEGIRTEKAIALNVMDQLSDENRLGIVAFNFRAYGVMEPRPLSDGRSLAEDRIRRLESGGATRIDLGLKGAREMLGGERGTVILVSDGGDDPTRPRLVAEQLGREGIRVITVGVGESPREDTLRAIATASGGTYFRAGETDRLNLLFGGSGASLDADSLTVVDGTHFITSGVSLDASPGAANDVGVKPGADYLVATGEGDPALASWRYGLGRVAALTTYDDEGTLDGLLTGRDAVVLTRTVNWAIGDPERKATDVVTATDTRLGESATVTYRGGDPPAGLTFRTVGPDLYEAQVTPDRTGVTEVAGARYAVNGPREVAAIGRSPALDRLVDTTGGRRFDPGETRAIARLARDDATRLRTVRDEWDWLLLVLALVLYTAEVCARRIQVYRGRTSIP